MKKLLIILIVIGIYLNRSYSYFYTFLGQKQLLPPAHQTETLIGNNLNNSISIIYVALGDSLTEGVGVSDYKKSYPYLIAQKFTVKAHVKLINLAQAGAESLNVLSYQAPQILSLKPNIITLLIGANDIHNLKSEQEFEKNYLQIADILKKSKAQVYVLSIPYLGSEKIVFFPYNFILDFRIKQFNNIIRKVSTEYNFEFIDLYSISKTNQFYSSDQFHPAEEGYKKWSTIFNVN